MMERKRMAVLNRADTPAKKKKTPKKTVKPNADWERNWHLVDGNFNETIKGTAAFIFLANMFCVPPASSSANAAACGTML